MKISKTQLQQIIKEEIEAQVLKENIISDMVDAIKDSGEDAWDWIKDNAEDVKDAAAAAGETVADFADDVVRSAKRSAKKVAKAAASAGENVADFAGDTVQGALRTVDKTAGTKLSKDAKEKQWHADRAAKKAAADAAHEKAWYAKGGGRDQYLAKKKAEEDAYWAKKKRDDEWASMSWADKIRRPETPDEENQRYHAQRRKEREAERYRNRRHLARQQAQDRGDLGFESISRKDLERIIKEEIEAASPARVNQ